MHKINDVLESGSSSRDFPNGVFSLCACPVSLELTHYTSANGLQTDSEITKMDEKWGKNHLAVHTPSFLELLQIQLLSPLAMFQVFCALLWLLDEYWTYTAWSLVSVVIFETTTVFQRTRTQKMLGTYAHSTYNESNFFTFLIRLLYLYAVLYLT
jgi:manganese-transporting P-type ATPase